MATEAQKQEPLYFKIARRLTGLGIAIVPTYPGERRALFNDWQNLATTDMKKLEEWAVSGYPLIKDGQPLFHRVTPDHNLVCVAKSRGVQCWDIDDYAACLKLGMPPVPDGIFTVDTPGGGLHVPFVADENDALMPNKTDVESGSSLIFEWKANNSPWCGPWQTRADGGKYQPRDTNAPLMNGEHKEYKELMRAWVRSHAPVEKPYAGGTKFGGFHPSWTDENFCERQDVTLLNAGMVDGSYHIVPEECPLCGKPNPRKSTIRAAKSKFMFGGKSFGFVCHVCGVNSRDDFEAAMLKTDPEYVAFEDYEGEYIYADDDPKTLFDGFAESVGSPPPVAASGQHHRETDCPARVFPLNEFGNTERFEWRYGGKFLHTDATGWLIYMNGRWQRDKTSRAEQAVWDTIRLIKLEIQLVDSDKAAEPIIGFAANNECNKMMNAILNLAAGRPTFSRNYADFDQHPELFLCANGTVRLDTGEFSQFDPNDLLTKGSDVKYDPVAACPQWEKFLFEVMDEKAHMVAYLGRAGGYSLSAFTGEQCLFVPYGRGGTGKGTFVNVLQGIMGSYCQIADPEMLMVKKGDSGQPFELAGMEGARGLFASETEKGKTLALSKLKRMTGQDPIRASYKGRDHYTFVPFWKLWLATNDEPSANAEDDAFWERVKVIPFNIKFRNTDRQIKDLHLKLLAEESSGILNWFLQGHRQWKEGGLQHPEEVNIAVKQWQDTEDYLGRCLKERFAPTTIPGEYISKKDAYDVFGRWSATSKEGEGISTKEFTKQMRAKGFLDKDVRRDGKTVQVWMGLKSVSSYGTTGAPEPDQVW